MTNHFHSLLKIIGCDERRKATNLLIQPVLQMKLPLYTLLLSFTFGMLTFFVGYNYFDQLYAMMIENTTQGDYLREAISEQTGNFAEVAIMLLTGYAILTVIMTAVYTHRIIGPTVAIKHHVKALKEGLYSHRVNLRASDELKDLASELNELAVILGNYRKDSAVSDTATPASPKTDPAG